MTGYAELHKLIETGEQFHIQDAPPELTLEVQALLQLKGLYSGELDSIPGKQTIEALAAFKAGIWLAYPDMIGKTTASSLLELTNHHQISEQTEPPVKPTKTKYIRLPSGKQVYNTQLIIPKGNLTWGEVTKDLSRVPEDLTVEGNLLIAARGFQEIRDKYGSPLGVTSGYRPESINRAVGGAKLSQHVNGLALDIFPIDNGVTRLLNVILKSNTIGVGDGRKKGFIHCDWRRDSPRVIFSY